MKTKSVFYSEDDSFEYEEETQNLYFWDNGSLLGSLDLNKERMAYLIVFLTNVYKEMK